MTLLAEYEAAVLKGDINDDPLQREMLIPLQRLADDLQKPKPWFSWGKAKPIQGMYIYGPVGVGKTYLVDLFYNQVANTSKARFHFHHFMQQVDVQLRKLQGQKDPLQVVAKHIVKTARLVCFDEFLVHDVAYAMILADLIPKLLAQGVILVITSNTKPDDLYRNGVQRPRFLPAIAAINSYCEVFFLNEDRDYRLGRAPLIEAYLYPLNPKTQATMERQFAQLVKTPEQKGSITLQHREVPFIAYHARTIWFAFNAICDLPRSQLDYLELAGRVDTVFISNIPELTEKHTTQTIMFIHFIDVMYDQGIKIIISAAVPAEQLYVKGEMLSSFKRTLSRLLEMQSIDYLNRHPRRTIQTIE